MGLFVSTKVARSCVLFSAFSARVLRLIFDHFGRNDFPFRAAVTDEERLVRVGYGGGIRALQRFVWIVENIRNVVILVLNAIVVVDIVGQSVIVFRYNYRGYCVLGLLLVLHMLLVVLLLLLIHKNLLWLWWWKKSCRRA